MKRRSKAGGKLPKGRGRKAATRKRRITPKTTHRASSAAVGLSKPFLALKRERDEALAHQKATGEILSAISNSTTDAKPVFDAIVRNLLRLFGASTALVALLRDGMIHVGALDGKAGFERMAERYPLPLDDSSVPGRAMSSKHVIHLAPMIGNPETPVSSVKFARDFGFNSLISAPMLRGDKVIGAIIAARGSSKPFHPKQIELIRSFAAQAIIAIENTRLLSELRESLDRQTATSEVLRVISGSPEDLQPVFDTMLENAIRICDAKFGTLLRFDGKDFYLAAEVGTPPEFSEVLHRPGPFRGLPGGIVDRVLQTKQVSQNADTATSAVPGLAAKLGGARSIVGVPMLKDNGLVGIIVIYRQEVRPFCDKQIALVQNFAAQAVIAIENTRLLSELRQRTDDLTESLEQQTATSEVLSVISSSPGSLEPVFQVVLANATRICGAKFATIFLREGEGLRSAAMHGTMPADWTEQWRSGTVFAPDSKLLAFQAVERRQPVQVADLRATPAYLAGHPKAVHSADIGGIRTMVTVPMLKDDEVAGVIAIFHTEVRPLTDKQIELVQSFAAQAVIAIENARLLSELRESLEQQTATSEVLRVISSSPGELEPVFQSMLENATRICEANFGLLWLSEGGGFRFVAQHGVPPLLVEDREREPFVRPGPGTGLGRVATTKQLVHVADITAEEAYAERDPLRVAYAELGGARTLVAVPMLQENELIGVITIFRQEVRPFTDKQIALVTNFAAQAVIAIENTRLLSELRESLEQQTATAEVLGVINASRGDLQPVFEAMVEKARRLCEADAGHLALPVGDDYRSVAVAAMSPEMEVLIRSVSYAPGRGTAVGRALAECRPVQISDIGADHEHVGRDAADRGFIRTILGVPLLREGEAIGAFGLSRQRVEPFSERQIALVQNFAAQAVIAIENTRLLRESLHQQTATANVLKVISSSPGELDPVFNVILENAARICEANFGNILRFENGLPQFVAKLRVPEQFFAFLRRSALRPGPLHPFSRLIEQRQTVHVTDYSADPSYLARDPLAVAGVELGNIRTLLIVPMLKDGALIGGIAIYRHEVRPFSDKQIVLMTNFAAQAVIAIENTRLLSELRESLQQQTATADVLKVISRSTFDLQTVLDTLVESAALLCEADKASINRAQDDAFRAIAMHGFPPEFKTFAANYVIPAGNASVVGRTVMRSAPIQVPDVAADPDYKMPEIRDFGRIRTVLGVPMLREGKPTGVIVLMRNDVRPFTERQIELAQTFADQAVIAIENVRLFESVEARTRELAKSLEELHTAQDRLVQTEKLASLGQLTAGIAHEIKNPLNFVNNFSSVSVELIDELREVLAGAHIDDKLRTEISELTDMLQGNLDKVVQHGKRADSIVKNMLLHSREGSGEHRPVDINALVEESLNLAYHGARAEKQGFNITLQRSFDPAAGEADLFPQEITRVLLNLISNGFYAATKRLAQTEGDSYEPTLSAATKNLGGSVEIRIRDNGTGIPPEVKEKMFNPFFTTKPAGEGTGLGLSISHDIIVKQHGGSIAVDTKPGQFTEFKIVLPRAGASLVKR